MQSLKNIANTVLNSVKSPKAGLAALGLATVLSFSNAVNAQDHSETAAPINASHIQVPFKNVQGVQQDGVKLSAAMQSKDSQVVVLFGVDQQAGQAAYKALQELIAEESTAFKGMYIADPMEVARSSVGNYALNSSEAIMIYAGGQVTSTIEDPSEQVGALIKDQLRSDYEDIIIPRRTLAINEATTTVAGLN